MTNQHNSDLVIELKKYRIKKSKGANKMTNERATYNVKLDKKLKIERLAMEASLKVGRTVKWTEIMDTLVNEFGKDAQEMIIHKEIEKNGK